MNKKMIIFMAVMALASVSVFADEFNTTVYINGAPYLDSISFQDFDDGTIQVLPDDSAQAWCNGTFSDVDGASTVVGIKATFFGPSSDVFDPVATGTVYFNNSCTLSNIVGMTGNYNCSADLYHHSEPGLWTCNVSIQDDVGQTTSNQTTNTIDTLQSIQVPDNMTNATQNATLDFGYYALGQNSSTNDFPITVNNTGNVAFNTTIDPYRVTGTPTDTDAMACTVGTLPVGNIRFAMSAATAIESKTPLTDTPINTQTPLAPTAFGNILPTSQTIYFGIVIPDAGIGGRCLGHMDISATQS